MGMFFPDDDSYDMGVRQKGFNRYKQLLSEHAVHWMKVNFITCIGALPLVIAIMLSVMSTSILLLYPLSFIAGMIFGPFYACLYDNILRGMRDDPESWWDQYKKGFRQNWKSALLPGGVLGILIGTYTFMGFLMYWQTTPVPMANIILYFISGIVILSVFTLFWSLLVLFEQPLKKRMINMIAFASKYLWKLLSVSLFQMIVITLTIMLAPWTLILIPLLGWYVRFLILYKIYDALNDFFQIENLIQKKAQSTKEK